MTTTEEGAAAAGVRPTVTGAVRHLFHLRDLLHRWNWPISAKPDADDDTSSNPSAAPGSPTTPPSRALSSCPSCDLAHEGLIPPDVPEGCLAVYVGEEHRRFVIPASYLAEPAFGAMLQKAADEFGFKAAGALQIPCEVEAFKYILQCMEVRHHQRSPRDDTVAVSAAAAVRAEQTNPGAGSADTISSITEEPAGPDLTASAVPSSLEN